MMIKSIYECDCCHRQFEEPTYSGNKIMSFLDLKIVKSVGRNNTIGPNGDTVCL